MERLLKNNLINIYIFLSFLIKAGCFYTAVEMCFLSGSSDYDLSFLSIPESGLTAIQEVRNLFGLFELTDKNGFIVMISLRIIHWKQDVQELW